MRLKAILGPEAPLFPLRLWAFAAESQQDGDFSDYSQAEIATICECSSNAQALHQALQQAGFLDKDGHLHDWEEHNQFHSNMAERARNAANVRWSKDTPTPPEKKEKERKGKERSKHCLSNAQALTDIPQCLQTDSFKSAWGEWQEYRKPLGKVKDFKRLWKNQLQMLSEWGEPRAVAALKYTMSQGWTGIFEQKNNGTVQIKHSGAAAPIPGKYGN